MSVVVKDKTGSEDFFYFLQIISNSCLPKSQHTVYYCYLQKSTTSRKSLEDRLLVSGVDSGVLLLAQMFYQVFGNHSKDEADLQRDSTFSLRSLVLFFVISHNAK